MRTLVITLVPLLLIAGSMVGQEERFPNRFAYSEDASVLPHLSILASGASSVFSSTTRDYHANIRVGLADALELGFQYHEQSISFLGVPEMRPSFSLKLRILNGTESLPAVALTYRSELDWRTQTLWYHDLQEKRPTHIALGLTGSKFESMSSAFEVIVTQRLMHDVRLSFGAGLEEFQYRSLWVFMSLVDPGLVARAQDHKLLLTWFAQASVPLTQEVSFVAEALTIPGTSPVLNRSELQIEHVYVMSAGVRYSPVDLVAVDASVVHHSPLAGLRHTEARVAVSAFLNILRLMK